MRSWLTPPPRTVVRRVRAAEATPAQLVSTGAIAGPYDSLDNDGAWRPVGKSGRPVPEWTHERARMQSVANYRSNPMATAIIDTYTSFCVGDTGVKPLCSNPKVEEIVTEWWADPRNKMAAVQDLMLRSCLLNGETCLEMIEAPVSGMIRHAPVDPAIISDVRNIGRNPLWPGELVYRNPGDGDDRSMSVVIVNDTTKLREGEAQWWTPFKTLDTDTRSMPFLMPVLDDLDNYQRVLSNLMDRQALARYFVWDVEVEGGKTEVDQYVAERGGTHVPPSGGVEVHNSKVKWTPKFAQTGAYEDTTANKSILTVIAAGTGLAKTWLAEPEDANRATSVTMAEPVRRRVGGVQQTWLGYVTEYSRFVVDRAVAAGRLDAMVDSIDSTSGQVRKAPASSAVQIVGPEVAAADAQLNATVLLNLSTGLEKLVQAKILTPDAAHVAARKGWEDYMGVPWRAELAKPDANVDDVATHLDDPKAAKQLKAV